jgi:hypothetical protein
MKTAVGSLLFLVAFALTPLAAQERAMLAIGGDGSWGIGVNGRAVGWTLTNPHHDVKISARLGNGGGHAYADVYLMRSIGPGTTDDDEVARTSFDLPYPFSGWVDVFAGLDLEPGEYWLIIAKPRERAHSSINWIATNPMTLRKSCDLQYLGTRSYTFQTDAATYLPASRFASIEIEPYGFGVLVTSGDHVRCDARSSAHAIW